MSFPLLSLGFWALAGGEDQTATPGALKGINVKEMKERVLNMFLAVTSEIEGSESLCCLQKL